MGLPPRPPRLHLKRKTAPTACHPLSCTSVAAPQVLSAATQIPCRLDVLLESVGNVNFNASDLLVPGSPLPDVDRFTMQLGPDGATDVGWGARRCPPLSPRLPRLSPLHFSPPLAVCCNAQRVSVRYSRPS